jgi:hypothetical protein
MKEIDKLNLNKIEIMELLKNKLTINEKRKNELGEVFTDPELIEKMLDLFPPKIWKNQNLYWLDPACGIGNFMVCVFYRLMIGLESWEKDTDKRKKHIIEKMLYMVEINKNNCKIAKEIFGKNSNIICADFLDNRIGGEGLKGGRGKKEENSEKFPATFHCIVGNPPFQDNYGYTKDGARIHGGKSRLYEHIFIKANDILEENGYICFLTPDNLFSGNSNKGYNILVNNIVPFVSFNPENSDYFKGIQQNICYFLMKKSKEKNKTYIENDKENGFEVTLKNRPVNPIHNWTKYTDQLIDNFVSNKRNKVVYNRGKSINDYKGKKYKLIYKPDSYLYTNNKNLAVGLGIKKIVLFLIGIKNDYVIDNKGDLGVGPNTFYISFETEKEKNAIVQFLNSKEYEIMATVTRTSRQYLKMAFIEYLNLEKIIKKSRNGNGTRKSRNRNGTRKSRNGNGTKKFRIATH